ncbi:MAG: hypothetical protein CM1200mP16_12800 [Nitrospina sp.]|nr:MAG: hypothetical protein CM1200mP16_12800 [Nitrospina sp.]
MVCPKKLIRNWRFSVLDSFDINIFQLLLNFTEKVVLKKNRNLLFFYILMPIQCQGGKQKKRGVRASSYRREMSNSAI